MERNRKSIVMFVTDQHNAGTMSCAGHGLVRTPNLDALASQGVRFERAYCTSPSCVPSRHSFLSGRYPHETGILTNGQYVPKDKAFPTFAGVLKDHGYETAAIGKMHFKPLNVRNDLVDSRKGFSYRSAFLDASEGDIDRTFEQGAGPDRYGRFMDEFHEYDGPGGETEKGYVGCTSRLSERDQQDTWLVDDACRFIAGQRKDRPFLLVVSLDRPHPPSIVPPEFDLYDPEDVASPEPLPEGCTEQDLHLAERKSRYWSGMDARAVRTALARYYGNVAYSDHLLGRIVRAVRDAGLDDDTALLYFSDHGEMLGARDGAFSKYTLYEDAVRVPLIVRWPGTFQPGTVSGSVVSLIDLYPTILDIAGIPASGPERGSSLRHRISRDPEAGEAYVEMSDPDQWAVITRKHTMIVRSPGAGQDALYDLSEDPRQCRNLLGDPRYGEIEGSLREKLRATLRSGTPGTVPARS